MITGEKVSAFPLNTLSEIVQELDEACEQQVRTMSDQLKAVIASDSEAILNLSEHNIAAQERYQEREQQFVEELKNLLPDSSRENEQIHLNELRKKYPEYEAMISEWQEKLADNIIIMQRHQHQLVQLLDFALTHNAALMRSIYDSRTDKNVQYQQNGEKKSVASGLAINREG
ncbi:hypothetical protein QLX67_09000 [Balneolaceae bacterium ANBcel3]|nr:hypothetical protein [Balneolaceae bacterium ANBcel3]